MAALAPVELRLGWHHFVEHAAIAYLDIRRRRRGISGAGVCAVSRPPHVDPWCRRARLRIAYGRTPFHGRDQSAHAGNNWRVPRAYLLRGEAAAAVSTARSAWF